MQLFFLISGYVMLMTARRSHSGRAFAISRASRLCPVYWLALIFSIAIATLTGAWWVTSSWSDRLINFTMIQSWLLVPVPNIDEVYWTLALEMQFYVLIGLVLWLSRGKISDRWGVAVSALWVGVSLIVATAGGAHSRGIDPQLVATGYKEMLNLLLVELAPLFSAGMCAYLARAGQASIWKLAWLYAAIGVAMGAILHDWAYAGADAVAVVIFMVVVWRPTTVPRTRVIQWYGKVRKRHRTPRGSTVPLCCD